MIVINYENSHSGEYLSLIEMKYKAQKNYVYFLNDLKSTIAFSEKYQNPHFIIIKDGENVVGHCALILDSNLKKGEAFFGFLDVIDDFNTFKILWQSLIKLAKSKNIRILKGPINATAWHQYRVMSFSDNSDFFKSELFCEAYYYEFYKTQQPSKEILYHSGFRENFKFLISLTEPAYKAAIENGLIIDEIKNISYEQLGEILDISKVVFKDNWAYTDLSMESFESLYSSQKLSTHLNKIYFLRSGDKILGYLSSLIENDDTLILKTIAILPEFQGKGLGNALVYKAHLDAQEKGYKNIIYALIREDNNIKNFPKEEAVVFRKYSTFEFNI
ncbi:MAG TPA: GNAT family N-acetyltransferase [Candidatus Paceibacterota bacterium]|nr:GNAT family N-acetyltransferase [Candidatus Paceibacterota bacterium]